MMKAHETEEIKEREYMKGIFTELMVQNKEKWLGFITSRFGGDHRMFEPEDLLQEVCADIFRRIDDGRIKFDQDKLPGRDRSNYMDVVMFQLLRFRGVDLIRQFNRRAIIATAFGDQQRINAGDQMDPCVLLICREIAAIAPEILSKAHFDNWQAIHMHIFQGKAFSEIALELGCPLATIKSRYQRGIRLLREKMGKS